MLVKKVAIIPFECIVRGYLTGSGWKEVSEVRHGQRPVAAGRLPECLQARHGALHAQYQGGVGRARHAGDRRRARAGAGADKARTLAERSVACYTKAADHAAARASLLRTPSLEFGEDEQGASGAGGRGADARLQSFLAQRVTRWGAIHPVSTSSSCVTGWTALPSTTSRPHRSCRTK